MHRLFVFQNIFRDVFDDDSLAVTPATGPADVEGWDSIAQVKLILAIEEEFGFRFAEDDLSSLKSVGQFLDAIEKHIGPAA